MNRIRKGMTSAVEIARHAMLVVSKVGLAVMIWPGVLADSQEGRPVRHFFAIVLLLVWSAGLPAGAALFYMGLFS